MRNQFTTGAARQTTFLPPKNTGIGEIEKYMIGSIFSCTSFRLVVTCKTGEANWNRSKAMARERDVKKIDLDELKGFDGKEGKPAYIGYMGKVYEVTQSKLWKNGRHMNRHNAGGDLSADIQAAPHTPEVLERVPQVGILEENAPVRKLPPFLERILTRVPMLRRHPHPMTIHFPIAFTFAVPAFNALYLITGMRSFEVTAFHTLGAAIFFTPITMATGFYTWWLNYLAKRIRAVMIKQILSFILLPLEIVLFLWRVVHPDILDLQRPVGIVYFLLVLALFGIATVIGWYGAKLTFPTE